jgi:O-antigen ligase
MKKKKRHFIPLVTTSISQDLILTILLIPLWWFLGIKFFIFHLIALVVLVKAFRQKHRQREKLVVPKGFYFLMAFIIIYFLSLLINLKDIPFSRWLASFNNLSFWMMGLFMVLAISNSIHKEDILPLLKSFMIFGIASSLFVLCGYLAWLVSHKYISINSLLHHLLPDKLIELIGEKALLLKSSLVLNIIGQDKLFSTYVPRSPGFNVYGPALGATMIFVISMSLAYFKVKRRHQFLALVLSLLVLGLLLSLSRMSVLALLLAWLIVAATVNFKRPSFRLILSCILIGAVLLLIIIPPQKAIHTFSEFRKGSTLWRARLYKLTLTQSLKKPFFGYGYKPRTEEFPIYIGSHSTYLGVIYKTGFLGFALFLLFWLSVLRRWWLQRKEWRGDHVIGPLWFYLGMALWGGLLWMITEDLDAPPIVAFLTFIMVGLILSLHRLKKAAEEQ